MSAAPKRRLRLSPVGAYRVAVARAAHGHFTSTPIKPGRTLARRIGRREHDRNQRERVLTERARMAARVAGAKREQVSA